MRVFVVFAASCFLAGSAFAQQDDLASIPIGDPAMARAVKRAQATLQGFLEISRHPKAGMGRFAVKVALGPAGRREFFWLRPFGVTGETLKGALANEPEIVEGYHKGQEISVPLSEVTDWMYYDGGRLRGNYSACVLVARHGAEGLAAFERQYGADCSALQ